jgi:imidazolonepropionase-like amidohydrolase
MTRGAEAISGIDLWVEAGVPAKTILQAMTVNAAQLMGMESERGSIRAGFAADIIATRGNPLEKIDALKQVSFVMKNGVTIKAAR